MSSPVKDVTTLLGEVSEGKQGALDELMQLVYAELRRMARNYLRRERADHTLQPTALVNEAYLRLSGQLDIDWQNREQFFGVAATMMRRILVNHAEAKHSGKRGGGDRQVPLDESLAFFASRDINLIALDEALDRLSE
ncbi:MAG: ECF-type sigma factor [Pyrinomonadaceae bacterium]